MPRFAPGDPVQTPFGKGIVREIRNNGRLSVDLGHRTLIIGEQDLSLLPRNTRRPRASTPVSPGPSRSAPDGGSREVDLHGLIVEEALARIDQALNDALLANVAELRFIHGRSGGKLRGALHQRLRATPSVRGFRLDPRNAGVTVVSL